MGGVIEPHHDQDDVFIFCVQHSYGYDCTHCYNTSHLVAKFFLQCHKCILYEIIDNPMAYKMEREKIPTTYQLLLALLVGLNVNK